MSSKTIFLASKSPRRRDLLTRLGYDVRVIASNAHTLMAFEGDEVVLPDEAPKAYVLRTARNKLRASASRTRASSRACACPSSPPTPS